MKNIGDLQIHKGVTDNGLQIVIWDAIPECDDTCPIDSSCPYDRSRRKCEMRRRYLESVINSINSSLKEPDELKMMQVGLMLVPLFCHLISFKILSHSLRNVMYGTKIHPVYKEIRGTMKEINSILKELSITADLKKGFLEGDSDYYDNMMKSGSVPS